jgi:hypothetical protein
MKFPGSKLLHRFELPAQRSSLEELLHSSRASGFTGLVEVAHEGAIGLIFYYLGAEVNALYRRDNGAVSGQTALEGMRAAAGEGGTTVSVFELPLDMAHLMRGLTKRQRLQDPLGSRAELGDVLHRLEKTEHTGTLEVQGPAGSAVVLLVRGRVSNVYFEAADGLTYEKGEARAKLDEAIEKGTTQAFLGDFSREAWKSRHEVVTPIRSRLERADPNAAQVLSEEMSLRREVLEALEAEVPGVRQCLLIDLMTGVVLLRGGRGSADLNVTPLAEMLPALVMELRAQVEAAPGADSLEFLELSTERATILVAVVSEAQEALALLADRVQPIALLTAALTRAVRSYRERLAPARRKGVAVH